MAFTFGFEEDPVPELPEDLAPDPAGDAFLDELIARYMVRENGKLRYVATRSSALPRATLLMYLSIASCRCLS